MPKRRIANMKFEVCSACQLDCKFCVCGELRVHDSQYQLSLEQLDRFLFHTERSGYRIEHLEIHGPGEPLLWRHLNEGLRRLRRSSAIGTIEIITNGTFLKRLEDSAWECVDVMSVNIYGDETKIPILKRLQAFYGDEKIRPRNKETFIRVRGEDEGFKPAKLTGRCRCAGPMLYGDKVFLFCGPPVFGAAERMGISVVEDDSLCVDVGPDYLEKFDHRKVGRLDACRFCWANPNIDVVTVKQESTGGGWQPRRKA